jgi:predicted transcriptional regulator
VSPLSQDFQIDYSTDFDAKPGFISYINLKLWITIATLFELLGLLAIVKAISAMFQKTLIYIYN